ncbi:MAG: hypothetical protein LBP88_04470 [Treponema sp.]|jgi:hypothetical protein|nr:hypothetical protein [Treponema sp.]
MADWMPKREQDLVDLCGKWKAVLSDSQSVAAYGWEQAEVTAVLGKIDAFLNARSGFEADDSSAKRLLKEEAKDAVSSALRDFARTSVRYNKKIPDDVKQTLGIHPADTKPTPHPAPASQPETVVENTVNHYEHRVRALNRGRKDTAKPGDAYGVRYAWQVGGERPPAGEDLPKSRFSRRTSLVIPHTEADQGKTAYYASCYENSKGDQGQWSPVVSAIIG